MNTQRRLKSIEERLSLTEEYEKYAGCEPVLRVGCEDIEGGTFAIFPDGHEEVINGDLFDKLTENITSFDVVIAE